MINLNKMKYFVNLNIILFFCFLCVNSACSSDINQVREPAVAGAFYPADPAELKGVVKACLQSAIKTEINGEIYGLVVPHAGYVYSGKTAAASYNLVKSNKYDVIIVLAPSHKDPFRGATIYPGDYYKTPLGNVPIDKKLAEQLVQKNSDFTFSNLGHGKEHAIEVQLPFIQTLFSSTPIIPINVGGYNWEFCKNAGKTIASVLGEKKALIIASSDLYHGESYSDCIASVNKTLDAVQVLNPEKLCKGLLTDEFDACGGAPIVIMQTACIESGANKVRIIAKTNSGDVTGQKSGYIVGYGAAVVYKTTAAVNGKVEYDQIGQDTRDEFLKIARSSIKNYLENRTIPEFSPINAESKQARGVFVTLTINGKLRGCIGQHESALPLYKLVPQMAVAAAFQDPRFKPLSADEFDKIKIKISVYLTNVYKINSLDDFVMGEYGIIMTKNGRGATFLPEVPIEAGWTDKSEEMENLCRKAELPPGAWKDGAEFRVYKTQVFCE